MSSTVSNVALVALVLSVCLLAGCAGGGCSAGRHEQTAAFSVPHDSEAPAPRLSVQSRNGAIAVRQADGTEIAIEAKLVMSTAARLEGTTISVNREADGTLRVVALPPDGQWRSREGCSFDISIPATSGLDLRTANGRIEVAGLSGPATLRTSNGRITVRGHDGDVSAESSNGAVQLLDVAGSLRAVSSNGAIVARAAAGEHPIDVQTSNGSVTLELPWDFAGRLELRTSNGSINVADDVAARLHSRSRRSADVSIGNGRTVSRVQTSNGAIAIRRSQSGPAQSQPSQFDPRASVEHTQPTAR